jgi:hypothetical protein
MSATKEQPRIAKEDRGMSINPGKLVNQGKVSTGNNSTSTSSSNQSDANKPK